MSQLIVVAMGLEARDWVNNSSLQTLLSAECDLAKGSTAGVLETWLYPKGSGAAKATHEVRVVYNQAGLATALDTPGAFVVYEGHSRYGQGPAFGPSGISKVPDKKTFPVNPWSVHFRMGYDATDTECIDDLVEHSVTPTEYDLTVSPTTAFLPDALMAAASVAQARQKETAAKRLKGATVCGVSGAWRTFDVCFTKLAATTSSRGDTPLKGRHYYRQQSKATEFLTSVTVGSADLDKLSLACCVFFMSSCSSHVHYFKPLIRRRKAAKSSCSFLLTANVCSASSARTFVRQVLVKKRDPSTKKGLAAIVRALNGESDSGAIGVY